MPGVINTRVTLDSNVLISAVKENEEYSKVCGDILSHVGTSFVLYQPTLSITELYNAIGKTKGEQTAKTALKKFLKMIYHLEDYGSRAQCERVGKTALKYRVYSADAFYLQTSLDFKTVLISLDEEDFIDRIKAKDADYNVFRWEMRSRMGGMNAWNGGAALRSRALCGFRWAGHSEGRKI